jgi:hypothetical protein
MGSFVILYILQEIRAMKSSSMSLAGNVSDMGDMRNVYTIFVGESERKKQCLDDTKILSK